MDVFLRTRSLPRSFCALPSCECVRQARPTLTGLFFTLYVGIIFLVCMNVIIGIVTLYFDEVSQGLLAERTPDGL